MSDHSVTRHHHLTVRLDGDGRPADIQVHGQATHADGRTGPFLATMELADADRRALDPVLERALLTAEQHVEGGEAVIDYGEAPPVEEAVEA